DTVEVLYGCSGFDIAVSLAAVGLLLGLLFRQPWPRIVLAMALGVGVAVLGNVPRIVLLTYIVGRYDSSVFHFWHGSWGGQIFMSL
ncbi:archaeosortase/exosortase family protein, partial [Haemophilus parainfluenzae]|uniref:archaeosortase/exosortase family protein n=1 Tax=Haemophilus parainfluenzae TaxID=729 RepID=UPI00124B5FFA